MNQAVFSWATDDPPMGARYRLEWRFRARPGSIDTVDVPLRTASERMIAVAITQAGDPVLTEICQPFDLPGDTSNVQEVIDALFAALTRVREHHVFGKGMGIAVPQIGIPRAAAIVIPPDPAAGSLIMLNPCVISESAETDEQYEGCLSFFDVRGIVRRPLHVEVTCTSLEGHQRVLSLHTALARLAAHEIDHLNGMLYTSRMPDGVHRYQCRNTAAPGTHGITRRAAHRTARGKLCDCSIPELHQPVRARLHIPDSLSSPRPRWRTAQRDIRAVRGGTR